MYTKTHTMRKKKKAREKGREGDIKVARVTSRERVFKVTFLGTYRLN